MFYQADSFRAMEAGVSAAWLQQKLNVQNLANIETPQYKAKKLVFSQVLDDSVADMQIGGNGYNYSVVSDEFTDVRTDGNNVDSDAESLELYKAGVQYNMLLDKMKTEFSVYEYALSNMTK